MVNNNTPLTNEDDCLNCKFFRKKSVIMRVNEEPDNSRGKCGYQAPPVVARLHGALQSEPATRIDYVNVFNEMPDAVFEGACSEFRQKAGH